MSEEAKLFGYKSMDKFFLPDHKFLYSLYFQANIKSKGDS